VGTLRVLESASPPERHEGEVYGCAYTSDEAFVLTGGWDGQLRLWDAATGAALAKLPASAKPLSCCAFSPDNKQWLSASMEGVLTIWDGMSYKSVMSFLAHTRPVSAICYDPEGELMATASWDRQVALRKVGSEREARVLLGHTDIVAGCRFTPDGQNLVSWSHDGTIKVWDVNLLREVATLSGHTDRVTAVALGPDGRWLLSGGRDALVRLWDLKTQTEMAALNIGMEVRCCFCLPDGETAVAADAAGRLFMLSLPSFDVQSVLQLPARVMSGEMAPSGAQLALGGEDGGVYFVVVEGFEESSLIVTARPSLKEHATVLSRFFGTTKLRRTFEFTCPACRQMMEVATLPDQPVPCPSCQRILRINAQVPVLQA
jgi:WD40 repeat protein